MRSRRALTAENAALREQVRLLQANAERTRAEAASQRTIIADLGRQLHAEQRRRLARHRGPEHAGAPIQGDEQPAYFEADPADTVPMPRVRSQAPGVWPPEAWLT